jgi:hypothetical protein
MYPTTKSSKYPKSKSPIYPKSENRNGGLNPNPPAPAQDPPPFPPPKAPTQPSRLTPRLEVFTEQNPKSTSLGSATRGTTLVPGTSNNSTWAKADMIKCSSLLKKPKIVNIRTGSGGKITADRPEGTPSAEGTTTWWTHANSNREATPIRNVTIRIQSR